MNTKDQKDIDIEEKIKNVDERYKIGISKIKKLGDKIISYLKNEKRKEEIEKINEIKNKLNS